MHNTNQQNSSIFNLSSSVERIQPSGFVPPDHSAAIDPTSVYHALSKRNFRLVTINIARLHRVSITFVRLRFSKNPSPFELLTEVTMKSASFPSQIISWEKNRASYSTRSRLGRNPRYCTCPLVPLSVSPRPL